MTREELERQIHQLEQQLRNENSRSRELSERYETLVEFSRQCDAHANSFSENMTRRNNRLSLLESLTSSVQSALRYQRKMKDALTGADYRNTVGAINELTESVNREKNSVRAQSEECDRRIRDLTGRLYRLRTQLASLPKEDTEND